MIKTKNSALDKCHKQKRKRFRKSYRVNGAIQKCDIAKSCLFLQIN